MEWKYEYLVLKIIIIMNTEWKYWNERESKFIFFIKIIIMIIILSILHENNGIILAITIVFYDGNGPKTSIFT